MLQIKRYATNFLLVIVLLLGVGCSNTIKGSNPLQEPDKNTTTSQNVSKKYIENKGKGYKILSYDGISEKYVLTKEKIIQEPYLVEQFLIIIEPQIGMVYNFL
ncbi:hypothetical protein [Desulfofarcimen acetoxidans]|uniref:hypothetical protein n=1 Tax=Desulfofarcimen acetoxidans TaxID=58138 RepID=UPI00019E6387|nr:hypothetical protein [Desulfofarcimen acetoxidans]